MTTSADAYLYLSGDKFTLSSSPQGQRVEIPKPGGGTRMLGIPTVQDRFIQQLLLQVMTPIFETIFSEHSYGFRPGRCAQDAVLVAQKYAQGGKDWVVDLDITKFFDHVNHDILMTRIGKQIGDKRVLRLIGKYLRRGALVDGKVIPCREGTPDHRRRALVSLVQDKLRHAVSLVARGPLSPLLGNIYLDELDKELEKRGHAFCRYADDYAPRAQRAEEGLPCVTA